MNQERGNSHASSYNPPGGIQVVPSKGSFHLHPDSFADLFERLDRKMQERRMGGVKEMYSSFACHGTKLDLGITREALITTMQEITNPAHEADVLFWQIHLSATFRHPGQLITCNKKEISRCLCPTTGLNFYQVYDLPRRRFGAFTKDFRQAGAASSVSNSRPRGRPPCRGGFVVDFQDVTYLQFYLENQQLLLSKAPKGRKYSFAMNAALGFPTSDDMRLTYEELSGDRQHELSMELLNHVENCLKREEQLRKFVDSLLENTKARLRVVFEAKTLGDLFPAEAEAAAAAAAEPPCIALKVGAILGRLLAERCLLVSKGTWWREKVQRFRDQVLLPYLGTIKTCGIDRTTCTLQRLREIYDLEQIVYHWVLGSSNNPYLDSKRITFLKGYRPEAVDDYSPLQPLLKPQNKDDDVSLKCDRWIDLRVMDAFNYAPFMKEHFSFLLDSAPRSSPMQIPSLDTPLSTFSTLLS